MLHEAQWPKQAYCDYPATLVQPRKMLVPDSDGVPILLYFNFLLIAFEFGHQRWGIVNLPFSLSFLITGSGHGTEANRMAVASDQQRFAKKSQQQNQRFIEFAGVAIDWHRKANHSAGSAGGAAAIATLTRRQTGRSQSGKNQRVGDE